MRVAKRVGLSQAEVARGVDGYIRRGGGAAGSTVNGTWPPRGQVSRLVPRILGAIECEVFLARREALPHDIAALHQLANCLGISVERVYELEASARRKLARALMTTAACPRL